MFIGKCDELLDFSENGTDFASSLVSLLLPQRDVQTTLTVRDVYSKWSIQMLAVRGVFNPHQSEWN